MPGKEKKKSRNSIARLLFVGISVLVQIGWILLLVLELNRYSVWISLITGVLSALAVLKLYSKHTTAAMKMPWIMLIMAFPVMGLCLYLLFEVLGDPGNTGKRLREVRGELGKYLKQDESVLAAMEGEDPAAVNQIRYLCSHAASPVYRGTHVNYFAQGKDAFEEMKRQLEKAERFIFMEYFIVEDKSAFQELQQILVSKARQGVEVRLMYDDIGSVGYVNLKFAKGLNDMGIHCRVFNPAIPILNLFMNHRDHRKITVIDGKVGFTGGYNLAEAYFDRERPYGLWKDTGVMLEGDAVKSLTALFLEMWSVSARKKEDFGKYLNIHCDIPDAGFVQPYGDDPLDTERVTENVYLNLISSANKSLYFITPYLIITDEMSRALTLAAKRGVDVRIITPGVPDKKTVYAMTRSYYAGLAREGVRIFEYAPGFCHAKQCICDGKIASIGTSNLDYRSLYLHFENNVLLYDCEAVRDMARDFEEMFPLCREVTEDYRTGRSAILRTWQYILRLFAPLM